MGKTAKSYPYAFHVALDGNGINGLEGLAGVCLFLFDPKHNHYGYKIEFFDGIAGGHTVSVNRSGTIGFLGNTGQHLLFYDARTLLKLPGFQHFALRRPPLLCKAAHTLFGSPMMRSLRQSANIFIASKYRILNDRRD